MSCGRCSTCYDKYLVESAQKHVISKVQALCYECRVQIYEHS